MKMDKKLTGIVYIDTRGKRDLLQIMKDNEVVLPVNVYIQKDGSTLYFEPIEEEEEEKKENKEKQIIEKLDEDGNTYFDLI